MKGNTLTTEIIEHPIDGATGLPVAPEGLMWQVRRSNHSYSIPGSLGYASVEAYRVDLIETEVIESDSPVKRTKNPRYKWWARNGEPEFLEEVSSEARTETRIVTSERIERVKPIEELTDKEVERLRDRLCWSIDGLLKRADQWASGEDYPPSRAVEVFDFTLNADTILKAANRCLSKHLKHQEEARLKAIEDERKAKLVGVYPPLSLSKAKGGHGNA